MRRSHGHSRREAIPAAFRGDDKKKSANNWAQTLLVVAIFGAAAMLARAYTAHPAEPTGEIMALIEAQNRTIAALRGAAGRAVAERAAVDTKRPLHIPAPPSAGGAADLAGVRDHSILGLDETTFRAMSVAELLKAYAPTMGGGTCEGDFGNGLVDRWRGARKTYCAPTTGGGSRIDCFLVKQSNHAGAGDNLCLGRNVQFNFRDFDGELPRTYVKKYVDSRHQQQHSKIKYSKGTWAGTCSTTNEWQAKHFPGWNVNWFHGFQSVNDLQCDVHESAPTLIIERDTFANFFHDSEDFVNTLIALAVLEWKVQDLQILITDLYPRGPFWPIWERVFFGGRKPLTAWDLKQKYGTKNVCFENAAIAILGAAAPITVASFNTRCSRSSIVRAYSDYVIRALGLAQRTRYHAKGDPKRVVVTFMARRSSGVWPEKRFCDSETSFFGCDFVKHLGTRPLGRTIKNDGVVVSALKGLEERTFPNGARVVFRDLDYSKLSFDEQIAANLDTDVMVGPHGAGLLHNIFMPDRAALVELFIDGSSANRHFHNLARWQGRAYYGSAFSNPVNAPQLVAVVAGAVAGLDLSKAW